MRNGWGMLVVVPTGSAEAKHPRIGMWTEGDATKA